MENLPGNITQSQLEEVISPYGQILELNLELRISDGEENFSADVKYDQFYLPYRMKIYTDFNLATWLRSVKFSELNTLLANFDF